MIHALGPLAVVALASCALGQPCVPHWEGFALNGEVSSLYSDTIEPGAPQLLVGGDFAVPAHIARFTGAGFTLVAPGLNGDVRGITRHDDGSGSTLYVTGFVSLPTHGGGSTNYARLADGAFRPFGLGNGPSSSWTGPAVSYNLGQGPKLLTSGGFGFPCDYVTQWNGTNWECLGDGLGSVAHQAVMYDDGTGPALFLVGSLIINGFPFEDSIGIAKWNGSQWATVGHGIGGGFGTCCTVFDDGSGPELFVGGSFTRVGGFPGVQAANIAKWNGQRWAALSTGTDRIVSAFAPFDDGSGMKLFVAGDFARAGSAAVQRLARWDGSQWSACSAGGLPSGTVNALLTHDADGPGPGLPQLFVAGLFTAVGGVPAQNFAVLSPAQNLADFNHDGFVDFFDYDAFVTAFETGTQAADFNVDGFLDFFDYADFVAAYEAGC